MKPSRMAGPMDNMVPDNKKTEWYEPGQMPARIGWYEVRPLGRDCDDEMIGRHRWDGRCCLLPSGRDRLCQTTFWLWRGLTQPAA